MSKITIEVDAKDVHEDSMVDWGGFSMHCRECNRSIVQSGTTVTFSQLIVRLAMHEHGYDVRL